MSSAIDSKHDATHVDHAADPEKTHEQRVHQPEIFTDKDLMTNAFEAENREHEMTLWAAVKDHPMACFSAFVFCFTIVSSDQSHN